MKKLIFVVFVFISFLFIFSCQSPIEKIREKEEIFVPYKNFVPEVSRAAAKDLYEEDDTQTTAKTISDNQEQSHNFYDDATDWIKFNATAGKVYSIETFVYGYADTVVYLYDGSTLLKSNDDKSSSDRGSLISSWTAPSTKTYYIKVYSYNGKTGDNRDYVIKLTVAGGSTGGDQYEEDDSSSTAKLLPYNTEQTHNFVDDANDWMYINAKKDYIYSVETFKVGTNCDTILYIYNSSLQQVAYNDDKSSSDYSSYVNFTATYDGIYYIKVYNYNGRTGTGYDYKIKATETAPSNPTTSKWTILVYLDADNNLSSFGTKDMDEMKAVNPLTDVNIIVLWDNSSSIHGYYKVANGSYTLLKDVGEVNMGDPQTAKSFIDYAVANYPAEKYFWIYWNHGGAVDRKPTKGVCWDDTNNGDHLTEVEQKDIMQYLYNKIGKKIDIVGFDACLMATAEIVYQYRNFTNYMVFSEQTEPGDGWDYSWLNQLKTNPNSTPLEVAAAVFNKYKAWYSSQSDVTFSVVDMSYATELGNKIHDFANAARNSGSTYSTYFNNAANFNNFTGYTKDLYKYLSNVYNNTSIPQTIRDKAYSVMQVITTMVKYEWHGSTWNNIAYGLSITLKSPTSIYNQLDLCVNTDWDEFCSYAGFPNSY
ncbi:MAG: clostripain-related cysteine peptidase [Spirochaetes bacterium]|nr:clostripain-related cysteine peptidase [Spirochaetota bacterium]